MAQRDYQSEMAPYFIEDARQFLADARDALANVGQGADDKKLLEDSIRAVHALKGAAGLFKQNEIHLICSDLERLLEVGRSLVHVDTDGFSRLAEFAVESLALVEQLVDTIGNDTSGNADILEEFQASANANYGGFLESFGSGTSNGGTLELGDAVDPEILECFKEEAQDIFEGIHDCLDQLNGDPSDLESIRQLARLFHTLKGSSGLAGLQGVQALAKTVQDTLEQAADAGESLDEDQIARVTETADRIEEELWGGRAVGVSTPVSAAPLAAESVDEELVEVFLEEAGAYLEEIDAAIDSFIDEFSPAAVERLAKLFHTIKGSAGVVNLSEASSLAREANDFLESLVSDGSSGDADVCAFVAERVAGIKAAVGLSTTAVDVESEAAIDDEDEDLAFFVVDSRENLESFTRCVLAYEKSPSDDLVEEMFRAVHTIKGASTLVGLRDMVEAAGILEDFLERIVDGSLADVETVNLVDALFTGADTLTAILQRAVGEEYDHEQADRNLAAVVAELVEAVSRKQAVVLETAGPDLSAVDADDEIDDLLVVDPQAIAEVRPELPAASLDTPTPKKARRLAEAAEKTPADKERKDRQTIRIDSNRLNQVMNLVGELITSRTRLSSRVSGLGGIREELGARKDRLLELVNDFQIKYEFGQTLGRLGGMFGDDSESEFSELEFDRYDDFNILSRGLMEITSDVSEIMSQLDRLFREVAEEANNVSKVTSNMQYEITQLRMVPAATLFDRLRRPIRDAARKEGKQVELTCLGEETELDKAIIDDLFSPFLHLVRNAVSHGIESTDVRRSQSKVAAGTIALKAYQEGNNVVIEVHDDGAGIDLDAVKERGRDLGILHPTEEPTEEELLSLIFRSGFSTRSQVSDVSGRGVGMDAVADTINRLNGSISVQSLQGVGTKVVVRLPLTLAINQALIVSVCQQTFAIPLNYVEEAISIDLNDVETLSGAEVIRIRGTVVPLVRIGRRFGLQSPDGEKANTAVVVTMDGRRVALLVDRVLRRQEIVVKSSGEFLRQLRHIGGGTIGGDGGVYFIVDVPTVIAQPDESGSSINTDERSFQSAEPTKKLKRQGRWVLVVDDSISVRKVASKLLVAAGFKVDLAVDGLDALEYLRQNKYEAVLTDLEMPQMHGYELIAEIRRLKETRDLPIVVVTSRTGQKHVQKALDLGANAYLGKPFTQNDLISNIEKVIRQAAMTTV